MLIRCDVPGDVLVGFGGGDLTVRAAGGRFVAGAAIRADRVGVAAYLGAGCATARRRLLPDGAPLRVVAPALRGRGGERVAARRRRAA